MKTTLISKWAVPVSFYELDPCRSVQAYVKSTWQVFCRPFYDEPRRLSPLRPALAVLLLAPLVALQAAENQPIPIWPEGAPGALGTTEKDRPTITPYLPAKPSGAAILLIPGGSYGNIYLGQTEPFALWLNQQGIAAFVLRYRLGSAGYRYPSQLQDAVEAMRQIREQAAKWKIDPQRIGAMGFSAGGHLLTTLLNRPEDGEVPDADAKGRASPRPDIAIVCYPVISMITKPHFQSLKNLLGDAPADELLRKTSSEQQVHTGLPPVFLWHTCEDKLVPVDHSILYAAALREHGIPCELHLYQHGGHGTGLTGTRHPWFDDLLFWLRAQGFVGAAD
jgi:acetyl esterase/lipase